MVKRINFGDGNGGRPGERERRLKYGHRKKIQKNLALEYIGMIATALSLLVFCFIKNVYL